MCVCGGGAGRGERAEAAAREEPQEGAMGWREEDKSSRQSYPVLSSLPLSL